MTKDEYLEILACNSKTDEHELILECMDNYNVSSTERLTLEQIAKFCENQREVTGNTKIIK